MRLAALAIALLLVAGCAKTGTGFRPAAVGAPTTFVPAWCRENPPTAAEIGFVVRAPLYDATNFTLTKRAAGISQTNGAATHTRTATDDVYAGAGITLTVSRTASGDKFAATAADGAGSYTLLCRVLE